MIGTEFMKGQGFGNQLFAYVSTKCIARRLGFAYGSFGQENFITNTHISPGANFMGIDLGFKITNPNGMRVYKEAESRIYLFESTHDLKRGCYVSGHDPQIFSISDGTLIYGNLQDQFYFDSFRREIKSWLRVRPEFESYEFTKENLCVINFRGGEYKNNHELFLKKQYWIESMLFMKSLRKDMEFVVITDDPVAAKLMLPNISAFHFDFAKDYVSIKNANYLILSNSSFGFFPAYTSETAKCIIAPKFWARYNVSNGYWASEQNIYDIFLYMDRFGRLSTPADCRSELIVFKKCRKFDSLINKPIDGILFYVGLIICLLKKVAFYFSRLLACFDKR